MFAYSFQPEARTALGCETDCGVAGGYAWLDAGEAAGESMDRGRIFRTEEKFSVSDGVFDIVRESYI